MFTVDVPKFLVCFLTFFAISDALFILDKMAIRATADLLSAAFDGEVAEEETLRAMCTEKDSGKTD